MRTYRPIPTLRDSDCQRLWSKVRIDDEGCWIWQGAANAQGYGHITIEGQSYLAHRVAYTAMKGEIPQGLVTDHTCRNKRCIKPTHLDAVTQRINVIRGNQARSLVHARLAELTHTPTSDTRPNSTNEMKEMNA